MMVREAATSLPLLFHTMIPAGPATPSKRGAGLRKDLRARMAVPVEKA